MNPPNICTAGLNLGTLEHVRPLPTSGHLTGKHLDEHGGILRLARVIRFVSATPRGRRPEVEDTRATFRTAQVLEDYSAAEFWKRIARVAHEGGNCLRSAMGDDLKRHGQSYTVAVDHGTASLALLRLPSAAIELKVREPTKVNSNRQVRANIAAAAIGDVGPSDLPVTDIRFYSADHTTADQQATEDVNVLLRNCATAILAVGLSRPFAKGAEPPMHWLQVNGVFPECDPLWKV